MSKVTLNLSEHEAIVLFDWLARFNEVSDQGIDDAERRVLWDLESQLESILPEPFLDDYNDIVQKAKHEINEAKSE